MIRKMVSPLLMVLLAPLAFAQTYATVTGTVVDPNGLPFSGASITATLTDSTGNPVKSAVLTNGNTFNVSPVRGTMSSAGSFSISLIQNTSFASPAGSKYQFQVAAPNNPGVALVFPQAWSITLLQAISGSTDIGSALSALATPITLADLQNSRISAGAMITPSLKVPGASGTEYVKADGTGAGTPSSGSGTVSGQANGVIPLATGATTIGAQSALSDNGSTVTSTEPVAVTGMASGYNTLSGSSSGAASLSVAAAAGTPATILLPPTNPTANQVLQASAPASCSGYPTATCVQTSWASGAGGTGNYVNITGSITPTGCTVSGGVCTVSGSVAASVTFASIPGTGTVLHIFVNGTSDGSSSQFVNAQFNGDTSSSYYGAHSYFGSYTANLGSVLVANPGGTATSVPVASIGATTYGGGGYLKIIGYAGAFQKYIQGDGDAVSSTGPFSHFVLVGTWPSTAAITSVKLIPGSGNFAVGDTFVLYLSN